MSRLLDCIAEKREHTVFSQQTSLTRTSIDVPEYPPNQNFEEDPPHAGVDMVAGPHRVRFDALYGGAPRYWHLVRSVATNQTYFPNRLLIGGATPLEFSQSLIDCPPRSAISYRMVIRWYARDRYFRDN